MKKHIVLLLCFINMGVYAQNKTGINTTSPKADLDVNGTLRVREVPENLNATEWLVLDENNKVAKKTIEPQSSYYSFKKVIVQLPNRETVSKSFSKEPNTAPILSGLYCYKTNEPSFITLAPGWTLDDVYSTPTPIKSTIKIFPNTEYTYPVTCECSILLIRLED